MLKIAQYDITAPYNLYIGPLLSAGDGVTPVTDLVYTEISASLIPPSVTIPPISAIDLIHTIAGYYKIELHAGGDNFLNYIGDWKLSVQGSRILPYNEDIFVVSETAYAETIYGAGGGYAELTYASVSGANIPTTLASLSATVEDGFSEASSEATSNYNALDSYLNSVLYAKVVENQVLIQEIIDSVNKIGSISADIISGGTMYKAGAIIKDVEVRDDNVYLAYRDTDGIMKVFSVPFAQDIIIASGGDLT